MKLATLFCAGALLAAIIGGCSAESKAKSDKACTPGAYVYCRCQDRQEGTKLCSETGDGFGKCDPCETDSNPEIPDPGSSSSGSSGDPFGDDAGDDGSSGPAQCNDGVVQTGEDCDDKNSNNSDGCDQNCKLAGTNPPQTSTCPGLEVHVWGGAHKPTMTGSTTGSSDRSVTPTCPKSGSGAASTGAAAPDRVFKVVPHKTGTLTVTIADASYNVFLYAVADGGCSGTNVTQFACSNAIDGNGNETLSVPVTAGKQLHVFVDGAGAGISGYKEGTFRVTFEIP